jgi:2,5-diamino-6-(ribosylamino)-4(3H)-pyrimidinone 5'-phosphate reductase
MHRPERFGKTKDQKPPTCTNRPPTAVSGMRRPRISTNLAISADGKITSVAGRSADWTSHEDFLRLVELRQNADALLIGRGTLAADRMTMTLPDSDRQPLRCIVSGSGALDPDHPIFSKPGGDIHLLVTGDPPAGPSPTVAERLTVHHGTLAAFLETLARDHAVSRLHCEGGGQLICALAALDLIDDFHLTLAAHTLFGGREARTATGVPGDFLPESLAFDISHFEPQAAEGECFVTYTRRR